jgi:hypothetical protein
LYVDLLCEACQYLASGGCRLKALSLNTLRHIHIRLSCRANECTCRHCPFCIQFLCEDLPPSPYCVQKLGVLRPCREALPLHRFLGGRRPATTANPPGRNLSPIETLFYIAQYASLPTLVADPPRGGSTDSAVAGLSARHRHSLLVDQSPRLLTKQYVGTWIQPEVLRTFGCFERSGQDIRWEHRWYHLWPE